MGLFFIGLQVEIHLILATEVGDGIVNNASFSILKKLAVLSSVFLKRYL